MAEQSVQDRAVEAVVMHMSDPWSDSPLIRCDCDEPNLTVTGYARHLVDVFAAAGLLAGEPARIDSLRGATIARGPVAPGTANHVGEVWT